MVRLYVNSLVVTSLSVTLTLLASSLAAYAFSKKIRGGGFLFHVLLVGIMIPTYVTVVPLFLNLRALGLINTYFALSLCPTPRSVFPCPS